MDGRRQTVERERLFQAAVEIVANNSAAFKSTARRYSLCAQDAEDAYQRSLEILITKAPTDDRLELRPWLHTVVKHEALAVRRQRERLLGGDTEPDESTLGTVPGPEDDAAARERRRKTAEVLGQLKPSEIKCLLLKALGYSYDEIASRTGFSWTKVNRSLTEGRRSFLERFEQLEAGSRCRRFEPQLSAASDGEASEQDLRELRAHLRACHSCGAALRAYRTAPARLAELVPPVVALPMLQRTTGWSRLFDVFAGSADRVGSLGHKLQQAGELFTAQKTAAVVASSAALAGGAVATERAYEHHSHRGVVASEVHDQHGQKPADPQPSSPAPPPPDPRPSPAPAAAAPTTPSRARAVRGPEFGPEAAARASTAAAPTEPDPGGFETAAASSSGDADGGGPSGSGEFGP